MSQANAAARKRRAPQSLESPPLQNLNRSLPQSTNTGLTLPQVISLFDTRLLKVESFIKEKTDAQSSSNNLVESLNINHEILSDFNNRFEILAEEINNLKDIVLKLQSYTMDVNKTLLEERINVFSDLGNNITNENIVLEQFDTNLSSINLKSLVKEEFNNKEMFSK
jgi:hypothetical protein